LLLIFLTADGSLLTLSEWTQEGLDNYKSCEAKCHCDSEGPSTSCCEQCMADVGSNACKLVMNGDDSGGGSFILETSALHRELQECLAETIIMMEHHVGDSKTGKELENEMVKGKKTIHLT